MAELPSSTQAQCAIHPGQLARGTCDRCGNFMCGECSQGGQSLLCPKCRQLAGASPFPFTRTDYDFGRLWDYGWNVFRNDWLMLSGCVLMVFGVVLFLSVVSTVADFE